MRKRRIVLTVSLLAASLLAGCGSSSSEEADKALKDKKVVNETAGASSVLKDETGDYAGEDNLVYTDYLPSQYVTLGNYKGIHVNKVQDVTELSEEEKQSVIEEYLDANSTQQEITDRPAAEGDYVAVSYKESRDGQVVNDFTDEETEVLLGEGFALFEDKLYGTSAGDEVTATASLENEEGDGTFDLVYDIKVLRVYTYSTPELNDAFAKETAGVETAKELEEQIYREAIDSRNEISNGQMRNDLVASLLETSIVEGYPQSLYDIMYETVDAEYQMWGSNLEEAFEGDEEAIKQEVLVSVNAELVVEAVAEAENLIVTQSELDSYKQSILAESGYDSVESLSDDYSDQELACMLLAEKVGRLLEEQANITEVSEEEYENMTGASDLDLIDLDEEDLSGSDTSDLPDEAEELTQSELEALFEDASPESESDAGEEEDTE